MTSPNTPSAIPGIDFSHYNPPGIYMNPGPAPQLAVNGTQPTGVGIFGRSIGYRTFTQTVTIPQDVAGVAQPSATLSQAGILLSSVTVIGLAAAASNAVPPVQGTDYTVVLSPASVLAGYASGSTQATYVVERIVDGGSIAEGEAIQVSYSYTDENFFSPQIFYDYDDVKSTYGDPWNKVTKTVQSELTLAAQFAFNNGAYQVVCVAVQPTGTPNPSPTAPNLPGSDYMLALAGQPSVQSSDYADALDKLQDQPQVAVVVPACDAVAQNLCGSNGLLWRHVTSQSATMFERRAIFGVDGTVAVVPTSTRQSNAQAIANYRIMMVSPSKFTYYAEEINTSVPLGGQYVAASLAGMTVAMSFAQPLTRKLLTGWQTVAETMISGAKNTESQAGLCVVEQTRTSQIQVRHGLATDPSSLVSREWSITGQQDAMAYRLRDYLNAANLIGQPIYPYTLANVKGSADAGLQSLLRDGLIVDYTGLKVRQLITNPDVLEISYGWLPAFPLNYLVVSFAISLTTGAVNSVGTTSNSQNVTSSTTPVTSSTITPPATPQVGDFGGASNTLQSD